MLADPATSTLWTCQLTPVPDTKPAQRHTALRGFDLTTGAPKLRWNLPGDNTTCNDMAIGIPDKALYISDTGPGRIYRLAPGATSQPNCFQTVRLLNGIDGITFLDGVLYINSVVFNKLYRIPMDASGKHRTAPLRIDVWMDTRTDSILSKARTEHAMLLDEAISAKALRSQRNGAGKISALTIDGDRAHVTVIKDGLKKSNRRGTPRATLCGSPQRATGKVMSVPMPK